MSTLMIADSTVSWIEFAKAEFERRRAVWLLKQFMLSLDGKCVSPWNRTRVFLKEINDAKE